MHSSYGHLVCPWCAPVQMNYKLLVILLIFSAGSTQNNDRNSISVCADNEFECNDGVCISKHDACDGFNDCLDGSDETFLACGNMKCPEVISYQCAYGGCIDKAFKCNGSPDCSDGTDEDPELCGYTGCPDNTTLCNSGGCIDVSWQCDGTPNCNDGYDEDNTLCQSLSQGDSCILPAHPVNGWCNVVDCITHNKTRDCIFNVRTKTDCVEFICQTGFILDKFKKKYISSCVRGKWSPEPPRCQLCGRRDASVIPLIFGGNKVSRPVPWHIGMFLEKPKGKEYQCGGTIIHTHAIITAAHCVVTLDKLTKLPILHNKSFIDIRVGKLLSNYSVKEENEQILTVKSIAIRRYDKLYTSKHANDIALIIVKEQIYFDDIIKPVCLPYDNAFNESSSSNIIGKVVGWGRTEDYDLSQDLLEVNLTVYGDFITCRKKMTHLADKEYVSPDKFCVLNTLGENNLVKTLGTGDSGGGFIVTRKQISYLYGIVSTRINDQRLMTFTNVSDHIDWILNELENI